MKGSFLPFSSALMGYFFSTYFFFIGLTTLEKMFLSERKGLFILIQILYKFICDGSYLIYFFHELLHWLLLNYRLLNTVVAAS